MLVYEYYFVCVCVFVLLGMHVSVVIVGDLLDELICRKFQLQVACRVVQAVPAPLTHLQHVLKIP